jgi:hypothetical protein
MGSREGKEYMNRYLVADSAASGLDYELGVTALRFVYGSEEVKISVDLPWRSLAL